MSFYHHYLGKEAGPHLTTTSFQAAVEEAIRSPMSLLFSRLNNPSSFSHSPKGLCSRPLTSFVALLWTCSRASMSFLQRGAQNWTQYLRCSLTSTEYRGTITSLFLLVTLFLIQASIYLIDISLAFLDI